MPAIPYRDRSTAALLAALYERLNSEIVSGVVAVGFDDLRPAHGNAMGSLVHEDGLRTSALAALASMTAQSMGELIDDLEAKGYVERHPDPADRRAKRVFLTERGRTAVAASGDAVRAQEAAIRNRLGADGYALLRQLLLDLIESA